MPDESTAPRAAATVALLREGRDGPEVLLLRRHALSGFAARAWVFPGGAVDAGDRRLPATRWQGIDLQALTERFGAAPDLVLGFHVAAVRETFEEAGVLLAHREDGGQVAVDDPGVQRARRALAGPGGGEEFATWLDREGLVLDLDRLTYLSRWVTPRAEPRRYDACFFLATAPADQAADHDRVETTAQRWLRPATALAEHAAGRLHLIFPTVRTLEALAAHPSVAAAVAAAAAQPRVRVILPHAEVDERGRVARILHPDDPGFPGHLYPEGVRR